MKRLFDWFVYVWVRSFFLLISAMPRQLAYVSCEKIATLFFWLDRRHRRIGLTNLEIAFPEKDDRWRRKVLLSSFRQLGHQVVELSRMRRLTSREVVHRVQYEQGRGLENYVKAKREGRGILYLTAHISAWELLPAAHSINGYPLSFVVRPLDNLLLDRWLDSLRSRFGNRIISKRNAVRAALRLLKKKGEIGFLIDQNVQRKDGIFVPLFGKLACTSSTLAALALRTSAPVLPGFIYPSRGRGCYDIRFYPPIKAVRSGNYQDDLRENTALFNTYIEAVIREFPHCWLWGHRRFEVQPDGRQLYGVPSRAQR